MRMLTVFILTTLLVPIRTYSLGCNTHAPAIFYGNGMFNSWFQANESKRSLQKKIFRSGLGNRKIYLAYNVNETPLHVLLQAAAQKKEEFGRKFWRFLANLSLAPDDFFQLARERSREYDRDRYLNDDDLKMHVAAYRIKISEGARVIIVPHSQGNFYANAAWYILDENRETKNKTSIIGAAVPASEIAGEGPYVTLTQDQVMGMLRDYIPALRANVTNGKSSSSGHEFVVDYLEGDESGPIIMGDLKAAIENKSEASSMTEFEDEDYHHPSLMPFWWYVGKVGSSETRFTDVQCVALSAFAKAYDWFGESCEGRSLNAVSSWLDDCLISTWQNKNGSLDLNCAVLSDDLSIEGARDSSRVLLFLTTKHHECRMSWDEARQRITPDVVAQAKALLKEPPTGRKDR